MERMSANRLSALQALVKCGGTVHDETGRSTRRLLNLIGDDLSMGALTNALRALDEADLIERDIDGRRCYRITITDSGRGTVQGRGTVRQVAPGGIFLIDDLTRTELPRTLASAAERVDAWARTVDTSKPAGRLRLEYGAVVGAHLPATELDRGHWAASWAAANALGTAIGRTGPDTDLAEIEALVQLLDDLGAQLHAHRRFLLVANGPQPEGRAP